jgi:hypothetical protein
LKKQETSVILSFESAVYIRQAVYAFSALRREGEHFVVPPTLCSEGGVMLHDAFRNSGSAHIACNRELWHFRYRVEDLQQQKMTALSVQT